jgi:hypothetical protein
MKIRFHAVLRLYGWAEDAQVLFALFYSWLLAIESLCELSVNPSQLIDI